jgi:predicted metal-binding membrane protein
MGVVEALLKRDRGLAAAGLAALTALSWAYLYYSAASMGLPAQGMGAADMATRMAAPGLAPWGGLELFLVFIMWTVMMVGMMVPSAAPAILLYASLDRRRAARGEAGAAPLMATGLFVSGYLAMWTGFAAAAALLQWGLRAGAGWPETMGAATPLLGGLLLVLAGLYQWTPWKEACLKKCRSPLAFLLGHWRPGAWGAFDMGLRHGAFCVGCCWALMLVMFSTGVMNLLWMAILAAFILVEKVARSGRWIGRVTGLALVLWGSWMAFG